MFKNKLVLITPIIAFAVIFIFSLTLFPLVQPQPKNLPIAIVNEDEGMEMPNQSKVNMGEKIVKSIQESSASTTDEDPAVKWVEVKNTEEVQKGLDNQAYYAALIILKEFSAKQASLQTTTPSSPEVEILINQGMNTAASTAAAQILTGIVDYLNNNVRNQLLEGFENQGTTLTTEQVSSLVTPITIKATNVNEIGDNSANGNSPVSLFQPLWMASIASAAIIFMAVRKMPINTRKENFMIKIGQILIGAIIAIVIGFGFTWIAEGMVGLTIPNYMDTALFLTIASLSFFLMVSVVLSLVGFKGISIFVLLLFFGAPLLSLAPEMMSQFYQDWIYSWLPMRFMVQGLRELFFFGKGLSWNTSVSVLVWIAVGGIFVILGSAIRGVMPVVEKVDMSK